MNNSRRSAKQPGKTNPGREFSCTGLVLAGGAGRRFNGEDKGLIQVADRCMIEHVLERLQPQVQSLIICCNRNQPRYEEAVDRYRAQAPSPFEILWVSDAEPDVFHGPLAGIEALLEKTGTEYAQLCPCDTPIIPRDLVKTLSFYSTAPRDDGVASNSRPPNIEAVIPESLGRQQSLHAFLQVEAARQSLNKFRANQTTEQKQPATRDWISSLEHRVIALDDDPDPFTNVNSESDISYINQMLI